MRSSSTKKKFELILIVLSSGVKIIQFGIHIFRPKIRHFRFRNLSFRPEVTSFRKHVTRVTVRYDVDSDSRMSLADRKWHISGVISLPPQKPVFRTGSDVWLLAAGTWYCFFFPIVFNLALIAILLSDRIVEQSRHETSTTRCLRQFDIVTGSTLGLSLFLNRANPPCTLGSPVRGHY